jgi:hypothetical protein
MKSVRLFWVLAICLFFALALGLACTEEEEFETFGESDNDGDSDDDSDDDDAADDAQPEFVYAYYTEDEEFVFDYAYVTQRLSVFAENNIAIYLAMNPAHIGDPDLFTLLSEAGALGIEVRAWVVLDEEDGYWPNELNVDLFVAGVLAFADWFEQEGFDIGWFIVDMEIDWNLADSLFSHLENGQYIEAVMLLYNNVDPEMFAQSSAKFQQLVDDLGARGYKTMVVTFSQILDDLKDDDTVIQDALNTPVSTVQWDEVSTMAYSTVFDTLAGGMEFGPYMVYDYALSTIEHFGDTASIALGLNRDMENLSTLTAEIAAAKAAGIKNIQVYAFEGAMNKPNPDDWHDAFLTEEAVPENDGATDILRNILQGIDRIF